jgi:tripartite-type tricarboxylate transporter receptor subunit TctC
MNAIRLVSAVFACLFATAVFAQAYPTRPVTFLVPWPPGGSTDLAMRSLSVLAEKHLGQRIVIENKPGVSGTMGAQALAKKTFEEEREIVKRLGLKM